MLVGSVLCIYYGMFPFFALQKNITFYLNANSQVIDNIFGPIFPYTHIQMVFDMFGIHTLSRGSQPCILLLL